MGGTQTLRGRDGLLWVLARGWDTEAEEETRQANPILPTPASPQGQPAPTLLSRGLAGTPPTPCLNAPTPWEEMKTSPKPRAGRAPPRPRWCGSRVPRCPRQGGRFGLAKARRSPRASAGSLTLSHHAACVRKIPAETSGLMGFNRGINRGGLSGFAGSRAASPSGGEQEKSPEGCDVHGEHGWAPTRAGGRHAGG